MNVNWKWLSALLFCTSISVGGLSIYYYNQLESVSKNYETVLRDIEALTILVDIKLDYGNNTITWFNDTRMPLGSSLLNATKMIAKVDITETDFGVFIESINGVGGGNDKFWIWNYYDSILGEWAYGPVGADQWILHEKDKVSWSYTSF